jgi:hypothetical protein
MAAMGPDDPDDTNPGGLDVDAVHDERGHTQYVVLDDAGVAEVAEEISALTPAAQQRAAAEGFPGARHAAGADASQPEDPT